MWDIIVAVLNLIAVALLVCWMVQIGRWIARVEIKADAMGQVGPWISRVEDKHREEIRQIKLAVVQLQNRDDAIGARLSKLDGLDWPDKKDPAHLAGTPRVTSTLKERAEAVARPIPKKRADSTASATTYDPTPTIAATSYDSSSSSSCSSDSGSSGGGGCD